MITFISIKKICPFCFMAHQKYADYTPSNETYFLLMFVGHKNSAQLTSNFVNSHVFAILSYLRVGTYFKKNFSEYNSKNVISNLNSVYPYSTK